ncbi:MAG: CPBP family intramembrane glutamic endopeptidase [Myxococcota bacterium]
MPIAVRLLLALSLVGVGVVAVEWTIALAASGDVDTLVGLCTSALVAELWLLIVVGVCLLLGRRSPTERLGLAPGRLGARDVALLVLGTLALSHALDGLLELTGLAEQSVLSRIPEILAGARGWRLALAIVALGVAPGVAEELLCRGLVQRGLTRRLGPTAGIGLAALVFGALHLEPIHAAFASVLGVWLGLVAHWARSVRPAIVCHAANNLTAVGLAVGIGDLPLPAEASLVGGTLVAALCLMRVWGRMPRGSAALPLQPDPQSSDR